MCFWLVILEAWMNWVDAVYEKQSTATDAPPEIPPMFRAEPAVIEAERIVQGRSISRAITDDRVIR